MAIDGLSQSTGVERLLEVAADPAGVLLILTDRVGNVERERIVLPTDDLLTTLTGGSAGERVLEGTSAGGARKSVAIEVRRNEVLLHARAEAGAGTDVAVGLDDLQDALEKVISAG